MSITSQVIDAAIDSLFQPQPADSSEQVRDESPRRSPRVPFRGRADAVVFAPPDTPDLEPVETEILTTDISRTGLSLLHRSELHLGQHVLLQLSGGACTVEVCWCCEVWEGLYIAGCRFVDASFPKSID
jgi:hypothetical protein